MNAKRPKGLSLHLGLNKLNASHYIGWSSPLESALQDALDLSEMAKLSGFMPHFLFDEAANRNNFIQILKKMARQLKKDDILFLSFSGFGSFIPAYSAQKEDEFDVGWCLYDGLLLEGELLEQLAVFEPGVRILIVQDNSYFGVREREDAEIEQNARTLPKEIAWRTYMAHKDYYDSLHLRIGKKPDIQASIKYYSACQDNQVAYENRYNGLFTSMLKSNFNGGRVSENYYQFYRSILHKLPPHQSPSFKELGPPCAWFDQQKPFQIA